MDGGSTCIYRAPPLLENGGGGVSRGEGGLPENAREIKRFLKNGRLQKESGRVIPILRSVPKGKSFAFR